MAWLSGYTLIRIILSVHLFIGFLLIKAPTLITEQPLIFVLGEAIGLPHPRSSFQLNPVATSLLGIMFIFSGLSDLVAVSGTEEISRGYWDAQAPLRMLFYFCLTGYTYMFRPGRGNMSTVLTKPLKNSLVFSWGFIELIMWFWIYTQLREERNNAQQRIENRKRMQAKLNGDDVDDYGR